MTISFYSQIVFKVRGNNMTGAYLFNSENKPTEVEYLTDEERFDVFIDRTPEELIGWINRLSEAIVELENTFKLGESDE